MISINRNLKNISHKIRLFCYKLNGGILQKHSYFKELVTRAPLYSNTTNQPLSFQRGSAAFVHDRISNLSCILQRGLFSYLPISYSPERCLRQSQRIVCIRHLNNAQFRKSSREPMSRKLGALTSLLASICSD